MYVRMGSVFVYVYVSEGVYVCVSGCTLGVCVSVV
jgi:hypothetical protein